MLSLWYAGHAEDKAIDVDKSIEENGIKDEDVVEFHVIQNGGGF